MKYLPINSTLFIQNRKRLAGLLKPKSVAVINSNDIMPTSADGIRSFIQNTDMFYLSGIDQEDSILILNPEAREKKHREMLFVKETSEKIELWEGHKYTQKEIMDISGISTVYSLSEFYKIFRQLVFESDTIYLNTNEHIRADTSIETCDIRFVNWCKNAFPLHKYERLAPILHLLRAIKSAAEIDLIRHACGITEKAFRRLLGFVEPGVWEYEIEAEIFHEFLRNRSRGPAFKCILASGVNSCVLHYCNNNQQCKSGDILLIDFGAEYANYASDVTRTIPVNGRFTRRQRDVYDAVLRVQKAAIQMLRPGNTFDEYNKKVGNLMEAELIRLGLLDEEAVKNQPESDPLYKKYFMHGISHHLGLDVHDVGNKYRKFEAGMVFTCEPSIYIRKEAIGVRIENDILITSDNPVDLTKTIPVEAEEIEELMNSTS